MTDEERRVPLFTIGFNFDEQGNLVMDTFYAFNDFNNLPLEIQHELINGAMRESGESPGYTGREKISLH